MNRQMNPYVASLVMALLVLLVLPTLADLPQSRAAAPQWHDATETPAAEEEIHT